MQSEEKGGRISKYKRKEGEKNGEGRVARKGGGGIGRRWRGRQRRKVTGGQRTGTVWKKEKEKERGMVR